MAMSFVVMYHPEVVKEDIPALPKKERERIQTAIEQKLTTRPEVFGKPLRRSLKGYRKLRVGDYRVIFRIQGSTVKIFVIGNRSIVYEQNQQRFQ